VIALILRPEDSLADLFARGTILWRRCSVLSGRMFVPDFNFIPASNSLDSMIARIMLDSRGIDEPIVIQANTEDNKPADGILLFVEGEPPPDWTYLVVTKVSRKMVESSTMDRQGAVNAKYGSGITTDDYLRFREAIYHGKLEREEETFHSKMLRARSCIMGTGLKRCVIDGIGSLPMQYTRFKDVHTAERDGYHAGNEGQKTESV